MTYQLSAFFPKSVTLPDLERLREVTLAKKDTIAVCISALLYPDFDVSLKFVEWIELHREQGYGKVSTIIKTGLIG